MPRDNRCEGVHYGCSCDVEPDFLREVERRAGVDPGVMRMAAHAVLNGTENGLRVARWLRRILGEKP